MAKLMSPGMTEGVDVSKITWFHLAKTDYGSVLHYVVDGQSKVTFDSKFADDLYAVLIVLWSKDEAIVKNAN